MSGADVVGQHQPVVLGEGRRHQPPHVLVAAEAVREHHGTAVLRPCHRHMVPDPDTHTPELSHRPGDAAEPCSGRDRDRTAPADHPKPTRSSQKPSSCASRSALSWVSSRPGVVSRRSWRISRTWSRRTSWLLWSTPLRRSRSVRCRWPPGDEVPARLNLSPRVAQLLCDAGLDAVHVRDKGLQHVADSVILDFARQHGFVLAPRRHRFRELLARQRTTVPSFVLLRTYEPLTPDEQAAVLLANLPRLRDLRPVDPVVPRPGTARRVPLSWPCPRPCFPAPGLSGPGFRRRGRTYDAAHGKKREVNGPSPLS
jgi:predicted nuclease of predicted toxin-antitoxin system